MNKWIKSVILLPVLAVGLQACGPKYKSEESCGFVQNVYGERISWKDNAPIEIYIHQSVPQEMYRPIELALEKWETTAKRPLFKIRGYGVPGPLNPRQDGVNMIYWMNEWEANKQSEQARTSVYWIGDQIREADIRINNKNFSFYIDTPVATHNSVKFQSLMVHELGHVLGLKHEDASGSVMATYLASNTTRDDLTASDEMNLKCEY